MLDWLVVSLPVAGYVWSASRSSLGLATDYLHAPPSAWIVPVCPMLFAVVALAVGFRRRTHAPIVAGMLCVACVAYELRRLTGLSLEVRLITWGCVLLFMSMALERYLRLPRAGITAHPLRQGSDSEGVVSMAGSAVLTSHTLSGKAAPSFEGGGGRFGGGGATGQY